MFHNNKSENLLTFFYSKSEIILLIYMLIGSLWILTSDFILGIIVPNFKEFQFGSIIKGVGYVLVSGVAFYLILLKIEHKRIQAQKMELLGLATVQISHDLKNVLSVIKGWNQLAQANQNVGASSNEEMKNCSEGLNEAQILIERLLLFTKNSKNAVLQVDLNQIIMDFGEKYAKVIISSEIHINKQLNPNISPILANIHELEQILLNLVLNAQYAILHNSTPLSSKTIEIKTGMENKIKRAIEKSFVTLEITDTGIGMSPKILKKIFDPFFTTKPGTEGSGLGLSSIAKIVKMNNGEIKVKSQPNVGTSFKIYWPVAID